MVLSWRELRDNPELLELVDSADRQWRWSSWAVMPRTGEETWAPATMALPPRLEAQMFARSSSHSQNGVPWQYYLVTPDGPGFVCCYVGTSFEQLHIHASEVRSLYQYDSAGEEFPWPSLIRISASDEFRKAKGGALLQLKALKVDTFCSLQIVTTLNSEWEQPDMAPVLDEDLERERAGGEQGERSRCGFFSLFRFCSRFIRAQRS